MALLLVIWVLVLLSALALQFTQSMRAELVSVRNSRDGLRAKYVALAGFNAALAEISQPYQFNYVDGTGRLAFATERTLAEAAAGADETGEMGPLPPAPRRTKIAYGPGVYSYVIVDEDSRFNINSLVRRDPDPNPGQRSAYNFMRELLLRQGMEEGADLDTLMDSILDWRDRDDLHGLNGAESDWYEANYREQGMDRPYRAKNDRFDSVDELLMVRGMTPALLYGGERLPGHLRLLRKVAERLEASGQSAENILPAWVKDAEQGDYQGIARFLTVNGYASSNQVKLNRNTASPMLLELAYPGKVAEIMAARTASGYYATTERSRFFTVTAEGIVGAARYRFAATVRKMGGNARAAIHVERWLPDAEWPETPYSTEEGADLYLTTGDASTTTP